MVKIMEKSYKVPEEERGELYNLAAERLWEKIEFRWGELKIGCLDDLEASPWDKFCKFNPMVKKLAEEVESELNYELSEFQCSWAVKKFYNNANMRIYNRGNFTSLKPKE